MDKHGTIFTSHLRESVGSIGQVAWDACAQSDDPFVSHAFLTALEASGCVGPGTGWQPAPITVETDDGTLIGAIPAYVKGHSQGEYVFDHSWADAYERAGGRYYPKLQIAVPFSPVPGRRLLVQDGHDEAAIARQLIASAQSVVDNSKLSSAHATFVTREQIELFENAGWLIREDSQFHWYNRDYGRFDDFLADLSSAKRKNIRKERAAAVAGLDIVQLTGSDVREHHWDAFWEFYLDTGSRKWGSPYLNRAFFRMLGDQIADQILLILAFRDDRPIAGALNLIGSDTLYGRYWGCSEHVPHLHFELCYYQAIDFAIAHGLSRVEAGAQGGHKLVRGYEPAATWSAHYIADPGFRKAVADFLAQERQAVARDRAWLEQKTPFRKG